MALGQGRTSAPAGRLWGLWGTWVQQETAFFGTGGPGRDDRICFCRGLFAQDTGQWAVVGRTWLPRRPRFEFGLHHMLTYGL